jgi:hypothetical protein
MSFLKTLGKVAGGVGGFVLGGPAGAYAGYKAADALTGGGGGGHPNTTADAYGNATTSAGQNSATDRNSFLDALNGGQEALNASTQAAVSSAMPQFQQQLQGIRESAERRGVSNGDIETNSEGTLASAFQRNIANATASHATEMQGQKVGALGGLQSEERNQYLDLLSGNLDRQQQEKNRKQSFWNSIIGAGGAAAGAYFGSR